MERLNRKTITSHTVCPTHFMRCDVHRIQIKNHVQGNDVVMHMKACMRNTLLPSYRESETVSTKGQFGWQTAASIATHQYFVLGRGFPPQLRFGAFQGRHIPRRRTVMTQATGKSELRHPPPRIYLRHVHLLTRSNTITVALASTCTRGQSNNHL